MEPQFLSSIDQFRNCAASFQVNFNLISCAGFSCWLLPFAFTSAHFMEIPACSKPVFWILPWKLTASFFCWVNFHFAARNRISEVNGVLNKFCGSNAKFIECYKLRHLIYFKYQNYVRFDGKNNTVFKIASYMLVSDFHLKLGFWFSGRNNAMVPKG